MLALKMKNMPGRTLYMVLLCMLVSSCGFTLRSDYHLPDNINQVELVSAQAHSLLQRALSKRLKAYQIRVLSGQQQVGAKVVLEDVNTVGIYLFPDNLDRRLLSLFPTGQVAEYELIYSVRCQLLLPGQEPQLIEFDVNREYQDDPDTVLAKSRELELVLYEMRLQAADMIIRHMARLQALQTN
jgi:LPS-assembly lipoprotein